MNHQLNFSFRYDKLNSNEYSTIRKKNAINLYQIGNIFDISINHIIDHQARLIKKELKSIHELSLDFLIQDSKHDNFTINSKEEFMQFLRTFWSGPKAITRLDEPIAILYFQKI